jgi:hypothetical protein
MKEWIFKIIAVTIGIGAACLLLEIVTRIYYPQIKYDPPQFLYEVDPFRGYRHTPHFSGQWATEFGTVSVETDRFGFRNPDRDITEEALVILGLGDSFTFAPELEQGETFLAKLETDLQAQSPRPVHVLNAGVNGYGTIQEVQLLRDHVDRIKPQIVILAFYMNDIRDNRYEADRGPTRTVRDGWLVPASDPDRRPKPHTSHLHAFLTNRSEWFLNRYIKPRSHLRPVMKETDEQAAHAMDLTHQALLNFAETCREINAVPLVMTIPSGRQSRPWLYDDFPIDQSELHIDKPQQLVENICQQSGIRHINLLPVFRAKDRNFTGYFGHEGHWNDEGNQLASETLTKIILPMIAR